MRSGIVGGGSWRIGRVAGIDVAIDSSWILIFLLVTVSLGTQLRATHEAWHWSSTWGAGVVTSLLFFASILLSANA